MNRSQRLYILIDVLNDTHGELLEFVNDINSDNSLNLWLRERSTNWNARNREPRKTWFSTIDERISIWCIAIQNRCSSSSSSE